MVPMNISGDGDVSPAERSLPGHFAEPRISKDGASAKYERQEKMAGLI